MHRKYFFIAIKCKRTQLVTRNKLCKFRHAGKVPMSSLPDWFVGSILKTKQNQQTFLFNINQKYKLA
jgi:hypothetical protein